MPVKPPAADPFADIFTAYNAKLRQQVLREQRVEVFRSTQTDATSGYGPEAMLREGRVWRDGIAPPSFVDFVKHEMGGFLHPKQEEALRTALPDDPALIFYPRASIQEYEAGFPDGPPMRNLIAVIVLLWGKGSGKDFIIAYLVSYLVYVVLHMSDPWEYFRHGEPDPFDIINCAVNAQQAQHVFFNKLKNNLARDCFAPFPMISNQDHIIFTRELPSHSEPIKMLRLWSKHSENQSFEGFNVLAFLMDEASGFEIKGKKELATDDEDEEYALSPADEIYNTLESSASTRFKDQWLGFIISYPRFEDDFTMRFYAMASRVDEETGFLRYPYIYGHKGATWEINAKAPRESFEQFFRRNPEKAEMMYGCNPPPAKGGYFSQTQKIDEAFDKKLKPTVYWEESTTMVGKQQLVAVMLRGHRFSPANFYVAHCDPGHTADAFTVAIAHPNYARQETILDPRGKELTIPEVVIDGIIVWRPKPREGKVVDFINAGQTVLDLAAICDLRRWTADRWNSISLQQALERAGVKADFTMYSNADQLKIYDNFKTLLYLGLIRFSGHWGRAGLESDTWGRMRDEMRKLQLINNTKIDHQTGGSKDCADAVVGAAWLACQRGLTQRAFEGFQAPSHAHATAHQHHHHTSTLDALRQLSAAPRPQDLLKNRLPYAKPRLS